MREPLVSFHSPEELRSALWPSQPQFLIDDSLYQRLIEKKLPPIVSIRALGVILGVNPKLISAMAKFPHRYYRSFILPKKSGGERQILAPRVYLKTIQQYILRAILETQDLPTCVNGFVIGKGTVANGSVHRGARYLLNVDLADFFGSVKEDAIQQVFSGLGFGEHVAKTLAGLCTFEGSLPQGAPTSPYLSNLAFARTDEEILQFCAKADLTYTRYADDLTFSGRNRIPRTFLEGLEALLSRSGFGINRDKTRFSGPGQARYVTGLVVNDKVHPKRDVRRMLRAMFHRAAVAPGKYRKRSSELMGWASFVNSYNQSLGKKYLTIARRLQSSAVQTQAQRKKK